MKKWFEEKIFSNNRRTLLFISAFVFFVLFVYQIMLFANGTYFNSSSDDVVQYSPILSQYIKYLKNGSLSFYNYSNNLGASIFADVYYVPIDIFTLITLLLSVFLDEMVAFSIVELIKVLFGVIVFGYFLQKCKYKNWVVLVLSFAYFCVSGCWTLCLFPVYFSLFFYLPCSLLMVKWFCEGKKWLFPLYCFFLILYNFYNAYSLFLFMMIVYIVVRIRDDYKGFKYLVKDVIYFGLNIILGVIMGMFILLPSVLYIMNYSARNGSEFSLFFEIEVYFKFINKLFIYEAGNIGLLKGELDPSLYYQVHFSYYIGIIGLFVLSLLFFKNDKASKIYKKALLGLFIAMLLPITSMIFSGVMTAYLRWLCYTNIIFLYLIGHVLNSSKFSDFNKRQRMISIISISFLYCISFVYNIVSVTKEMGLHSGVKGGFYLIMLVIVLVYAACYFISYFSKQKSLFVITVLTEMLVILVSNLAMPFDSVKKFKNIQSYEKINTMISKLNIEQDSLDRIYINDILKYNNGRILNVLSSESSFHSFFTKSIYDYIELYQKQEKTILVVDNLKYYSPSYSRSMDYKYIVLKQGDYDLDYLSIYYEDEDYIVYENNYHDPFYVYENYYNYDDVIKLNSYNDYIEFQKKLFDGVILEENEYLLNKLDYNYDNSETKVIDGKTKLELNKIDEKKYVKDLSYMNLDYTGKVYINGNDYTGINNIKIRSGNVTKDCESLNGFYSCYFDGKLQEIIVDSDSHPQNLFYYILVNDKQNGNPYLLLEFNENLSSPYLNYVTSQSGRISLLDENGNIRDCLDGFCSLKDFNARYLITYSTIDVVHEEEKDDKMFVYYQEEDLNYYNEKKEDVYASNKILTYQGSTINIKYDSISTSNNNQVVVLPITYSEEWVCDDENYELVKANGGYLGLVVKNNVKNIDVSITFMPSGVKIGFVGTCIGFSIYGLYMVFIYYRKKRLKKDELI